MARGTSYLVLCFCILSVNDAQGDLVPYAGMSVSGNAAADPINGKAIFGPQFGDWDNLINGNVVTSTYTPASPIDPGGPRKGFVDAAGVQLADADFTEANVISGDVQHDAIFSFEDPLGSLVWVTDDDGLGGTDFFGANSPGDPVLTFDLGGTFEVDGIYAWLYTGGVTFLNLQRHNPKAWHIEFSTDGGSSYGNLETLDPIDIEGDDGVNTDFVTNGVTDGDDFLAWQRGSGISAGAVLGDGDSDSDGDVDSEDLSNWESQYGGPGAFIEGAGRQPAQLITFTSHTADHVRITVTDNHFDTVLPAPFDSSAGGDRVGLGELHFRSTPPAIAAVPEPTGILLVATSVCVFGMFRRRRTVGLHRLDRYS